MKIEHFEVIMKNIEVRCRQAYFEILEINQLYGNINEDSDIHINGAITVVEKDNDTYRNVRVYANLCNEEGAILYVLNSYKNFMLKGNVYFSFSVYCSMVNRFFDVNELSYAEIYVVFNEKE